MDNLNSIISVNLKRIREEQRFSLDMVAKLSGVSKSMLGQIERGESNPTITTVWKIANGLKVSFTSLLDESMPDAVIVSKEEVNPLVADNGRYKLYPFFPYEDGRRFEVYKVEIEKSGYLSAEPHGVGTEEFVTVFQGEITIKVGEEEYNIEEGNAMRFKADRPHSYNNLGQKTAKASMVIYYPE
ncbi:MAG: helix-turn-helix domain-containing protein [Peptostreptococcaceae bacterium]|nr:helix-turn-helix domain-containing protein [Peptostreptococcaceae bacterium]